MERAKLRAADLTRSRVNALVALARPQQWIKNGLVLAPLLFSQRLFHPHDFLVAALATIAFCAVSSASYVMNDLADVDADRSHPEKRNRPLVRGEVGRVDAVRLAATLGASGFALGALVGAAFLAIATSYLALQFLYSRYLKRMVIIDVVSVALGFVLRAYAGGVAIHVEVSKWLVFTTFLLALLLALARRRHELVSLGSDANAHRSVLAHYSLALIDQMVTVVAAATLVSYMIYTASPEVEAKLHTKNLYLTVPFVVFGIFRYLYVMIHRSGGGDPVRVLLSDRPLLVTLVLWIVADIAVLYL